MGFDSAMGAPVGGGVSSGAGLPFEGASDGLLLEPCDLPVLLDLALAGYAPLGNRCLRRWFGAGRVGD